MRPYRLDRRRAAAEETRARIVAAARELLTAGSGVTGFTGDAVARRAGVARMTVYYQFGNKLRLVEAVFDSLAVRSGAGELVAAIQHPEPRQGLTDFIAAFARFYAADRPIIRRLRGLAALDPDVEVVWRERAERRREGLRALLERLAARHGRPSPQGLDVVVDVLYTLTSFETFDTLAGDTRSVEEIAPLVQRLAHAALSLD
ncbi:MAG TPA: helix-turn-helix domain-containing protein [Chloroflexota bacterium]|jgi:AcrR family transcriptional regulator|nr:helix-turn-helix domain-containing protein [Chloroflexota bacterium]